VADPEGLPAVKVGVVLARHPDDLGEWLADATAFEAAGADALWVDPVGDPELDPLVLTAALAAITFRSLLVTTLPADRPDLARTFTTIDRLSRGRLGVIAEAGTGRHVFRPVPGDPGTYEHTSGERWAYCRPPDGRPAWRASLLDAGERGLRGLLVPADPRLLDILRNPDDPGYRPDLQLAQG
jgi:alkanesulfonate monooxygenase SsuD/methylene tetrahydromethanopterin reductase-like flavin-dependent oxidoreductase (luciferase family)